MRWIWARALRLVREDQKERAEAQEKMSTSPVVVNPNGPTLFNTIMADTVGVVWSAASGTVDPWTKQNIQDQAAADQVTASGAANGALSDSTVIPGTGQTVAELKAAGYADSDIQALWASAVQSNLANGGAFYNGQGDIVTTTLTQANADPSQFWQGVGNSFSQLKSTLANIGEWGTVALVALAVLVVVVMVKK